MRFVKRFGNPLKSKTIRIILLTVGKLLFTEEHTSIWVNRYRLQIFKCGLNLCFIAMKNSGIPFNGFTKRANFCLRRLFTFTISSTAKTFM
ncbi:hypothetical protein BGP_6673 [Beggiatoa sp. PS]|nr:hypothetical protein BGP_6673 [Beggiatoa sp. PS]